MKKVMLAILDGVGFRKGSNLTEKLNQFFKEYHKAGTMEEVAKKYGVQAALAIKD